MGKVTAGRHRVAKSERRALRPDAQAFDEVRIVTVPRYKTSGMSGDEWRISASLQFFRKGKQIHETGFRSVETACIFAAAEYLRAIDDGKAYFAGIDELCDQEGCSATATNVYRIKQEFCRDGHASDPNSYDARPLVRKFCDRHSTRGDCGLEDADRNYEVLSGSRLNPEARDIKESARMVVPVNSIEEIPDAIRKAREVGRGEE